MLLNLKNKKLHIYRTKDKKDIKEITARAVALKDQEAEVIHQLMEEEEGKADKVLKRILILHI